MATQVCFHRFVLISHFVTLIEVMSTLCSLYKNVNRNKVFCMNFVGIFQNSGLAYVCYAIVRWNEHALIDCIHQVPYSSRFLYDLEAFYTCLCDFKTICTYISSYSSLVFFLGKFESNPKSNLAKFVWTKILFKKQSKRNPKLTDLKAYLSKKVGTIFSCFQNCSRFHGFFINLIWGLL